MARPFRAMASISSSPAASIPIAARTTPATRSISTPRKTARSKPASSRLFFIATGTPGKAIAAATCLSLSLADGKLADLSPGTRDVPPFSLGGPDDYAISPDGGEVCFAMNTDDNPAAGTNNDLFVVPIQGGTAHKITANPGADNSPLYSPDGKYLAYRSQARPGYESDRWRLFVLERATGKLTIPTDAIDRSVDSFTWAPDSKRLFFTAIDRGQQAIRFVGLDGRGTGIAVRGDNTLDDMQFTPDGKTIVFTRQSGSSPAEICKGVSSGGDAIPLTHLNDDLLGQYQLTRLEDFWVTGAENTQVQSFIVKPPNFDPARKYPVILLMHGGPEGEWGESWTYRWNAQVFAGAGYVVVDAESARLHRLRPEIHR